MFNELDDMQERKLHLWDVFCLALAKSPEFLVLVLPVALLLALLYTLTNLARYNELTAMRAAGISLWRICLPYFIVGVVMSLALFALNEIVVPRSTDLANRIFTRYVQKPDDPGVQNDFRNQGFNNARAGRSWFIGEYHLAANEMLQPQVNWLLPDGSIKRLYAERAIITNGVWTFFNAKEYAQTDAKAPLVPVLQTNVLAMPEFDETPKQIQTEIRLSDNESLRNTRKADIPLQDMLTYLRIHKHLAQEDAGWVLTKLHGRLAEPWTCLVVVLIAIPFGAPSGRRNLFFGVAGSIFICFSYFVVQKVSLAVGSGGHLPGWLAAWLPNIIFGTIGLGLMMRVR